MAVSALSSASFTLLSSKLGNLSLSSTSRPSSLSFSSNLSNSNLIFSTGSLSISSAQRSFNRFVVCEAAPKRKADSAAKRVRQAEKRRLRNKARKSEIKTRMKKALDALDELKKKSGAVFEDVLPVEKLIGEAYSAIDKAVVKGTLHRNTGARRKSRLARRKKTVEVHHGWYTPSPAAVTA